MAQVSYGTITITDTTDIDSIKNWYLATSASSGVTKETTGWTDTIQQITKNKPYLWNYEQILGTGNVEISSTQPTIIGHFGTDGTNGVDGNSITSIDEYYQATNSTNNPGSSGWQKNTLVTPTSTNKYLWNYQVINYSKTAAEGSYNDARIIGVYGDTGPQGPQGNAGINTATVYLYQRAASTPSKPSGDLTYTFSSAKITSGMLGNWKQSIGELSGTDPIWVIAAVASSNGTTDTIASTEWSTQIKLAQNGTNGTNGINGTNGLNQATVFIYKRATSATAPGSTTYTFSNGSFTVPSGWSKTIPASNGNPCYVSSAVAIGNGTTATLTWNTPSILVEDGVDGISPTVTSTSNGVKIVDAKGNETYITNGINGTSYYTFVRYSANADGSNYVVTPTSATKYIGVYSGTENSPPAYNDSGWTWSKYVGDSATQYYAFVKYATDANGSNMQDSPDSTHIYVGTYTGTNSSPAASLYKWSKYVGDPGTPATQYYAFIRYATSSTGANMTDTPTTNTTYVGTYSGTKSNPTASDYKWSEYVGTDGVSVTGVKEIYFLTTGNAPTAPSAGTNTTSTSTATDIWTTVVPTYVPNGKYYTSIQTTLSKGTSPISSTAILNNALTDSNYNAYIANSIAQHANEDAQGAMSQATATQIAQEALSHSLRKIWINETTSGAYLAGTYAASGLTDGADSGFKTNDPSTYGFNSLLRHTYLSFRYNTHQLVTIGTGIATNTGGISGIAINTPIVNSSNQVINVAKGLELTNSALNFYHAPTINGSTVTDGALAMQLTADALNFYGSSASEADATLNTNGLKLSKGGIEAGTLGASEYIYVWSNDDSQHQIRIGESDTKDNWRIIAGNKFGVDAEGNLYASNASIDGVITVGAGSNVYTIDQADLILDQTKQGTLIYEYVHDGITEVVYQRIDGSFYYLNSNSEEVTVEEQNLTHVGEELKTNRLEDGFDDMVDSVRQNAKQANNYLADIEKVVDVLTWVATHGQYSKTTDTEVQVGKFYFDATFTPTTDTQLNNTKSYYKNIDNVYTLVNNPVATDLSSYYEGNFDAVTNPTGNPVTSNWYELTGTDKAITNYIATHLVLTNEGLFIQTDDNSYKVQISSNGIYLLKEDKRIATYSDSVILGDIEDLHIILDSGELGFYQGAQKVAYINTQKLFITTAEVTTELRIGNFIWKPRYGRLSLIYSPII